MISNKNLLQDMENIISLSRERIERTSLQERQLGTNFPSLCKDMSSHSDLLIKYANLKKALLRKSDPE